MDLTRLISEKIDERLSIGDDNSFYILDPDDVRLKFVNWTKEIPRVVPFYAIKCNNEPAIVKALADLGAGFDCASIDELDQILKMGVDQNRIIYSHTVKQGSHLQFAADNRVEKVAFDSVAELNRIKSVHPEAKVVLRIQFDSDNAIISMGNKFGCDPRTEAPDLIEKCRELGMNLIGISFHIGSGILDFQVFEKALHSVRQLFDVADEYGFKLHLVDIGGGFMGNDISSLANYAKYINRGIDLYFKDPAVTIISEPGRYFAESALTLVVQVILKKVSSDGHVHYYINDSIYHSFLFVFLYEIKLKFKVIRKAIESRTSVERPSTIWGQTCSAKDKIIGNELMPEMEIGDYLAIENMGAYTTVFASRFNGFKTTGNQFMGPNGMSLRPNGPFLQEIVRTFRNDGTVIYRLPEGIELKSRQPKLLWEHTDHHSMQTTVPIEIDALNDVLTKLCLETGEKMTKAEFEERYPLDDCI